MTNVGLGLLLGGATGLAALTAAAGLDTLLLHQRWAPPSGNPFIGGGALLQHGLDPAAAWPTATRSLAPSGLLYWPTAVLLVGVVITIGAIVWGRLHSGNDQSRRRRTGRRDGMANRAEAVRALGAARVQRTLPVVRPTLAKADRLVERASIDLGRQVGTGVPLRAALEESTLVIGATRSGKGTGLVIPNVVRWRAAEMPAVVSSTRPDILEATWYTPGPPTVLWDPAELAPLADRAAWDIVAGCDDPDIALLRASRLVTASGAGKGVTESTFWTGRAQTGLRWLLHAAALAGESMRTVKLWAAQETDAAPVAILQRHPAAAHQAAAALKALQDAPPRQRMDVFSNIHLALAPFESDRVMSAVCPDGTLPTIHLDEVLDQRLTVHLLTPSAGARCASAVVATFVDSLLDLARRRAAIAPGGRLDPPLGLFLDEAAQSCPVDLWQLLAEGGGSGIYTMAVLQALSQARARWGVHAGQSVWASAAINVVLGGVRDASDLSDISRLTPEISDELITTTTGDNSSSRSQSYRHRPALSPADIRELPEGHALVFARNSRVVEADVRGWYERREYKAVVQAAVDKYRRHLVTTRP